MTNRRRSMMVTLVAVFSVALVVVLFFPAEPTSLLPSSAHPSSATSLAHNISTMSQPTLTSVVRPSTETTTPAPHIPLVCTTTWHEEYNESHTWGDPGERYTKKGCPSRRQSISCTGTRMHRALVIYMLQTKDDTNDMIVEMENFRYFLNYGVHGENQSTAMFDGVDYIFTRIRPKSMGHVTVPTVCASAANVKMMWVPDGVCDLCAHGRVIASLGGPAAVVAKYAFIVLMNAGARGPFQGEADPHWIDVFAMGGQTQWRQGITRPLMTGPSVSTQFSVHVQTHVLGLHAQLLFQYMEFISHCTIRKKECIRRGEIPAGIAWLHSGGWLHSLSRNVTIRISDDVEQLAALNRRYNVVEPMIEHYDVCAAVFVKFGGSFTPYIKRRITAHTEQLSLFQSPRRLLTGGVVVTELLQQCDFVLL